MIVYQQLTTGKLHRRKSCSITARTRYSHAEREYTADMDALPRCEKCWTSKVGKVTATYAAS